MPIYGYERILLTRLRVQGFKTLVDAEFRPGQFATIVGPNGVGKSNLVQCLGFLRSCILSPDVAVAIADHGGLSQIASGCEAGRKPLKFEIDLGLELSLNRRSAARSKRKTKKRQRTERPGTRTVTARYKLEIGFDRRREQHYVAREAFSVDNEEVFRRTKLEKRFSKDFFPAVPAQSSTARKLRESFAKYLPELPSSILFLPRICMYYRTPVLYVFQRFIEQFAIYDFDTNEGRKPSLVGQTPALDAHGANLPGVIREILARGERKAPGFLKVVTEIVPQLRKVIAKPQGEKIELLFEEEGIVPLLSSDLVSDGTIKALQLLSAVETATMPLLLVIEEPEVRLHPWAFEHLLKYMRDACERNRVQILLTTHSPVLVNHLFPHELFIMTREGCSSRIIRADEWDVGIKDIIGDGAILLGDYWTTGGLGGVPEAFGKA